MAEDGYQVRDRERPMSLVYDCSREIAKWVGERLDGARFEPCTAIGVVRHGHLIAGIVYSNYRDGNVEISMVAESPLWASRQNFGALLGYPFYQLGCRRVTCLVKATNQPVRAFLCRLGFREEGIIRQGFAHDDAAILGMLKSECKWLKEECDGRAQAA